MQYCVAALPTETPEGKQVKSPASQAEDPLKNCSTEMALDLKVTEYMCSRLTQRAGHRCSTSRRRKAIISIRESTSQVLHASL